MGETWEVAGKGAQQRRKQKKRASHGSQALARPLERPERFQHGAGPLFSRRKLFVAILILLAVALVIPAFIGIGLVGRSVPSPTQPPGGGARLVPNDSSSSSNTQLVTRPPQ